MFLNLYLYAHILVKLHKYKYEAIDLFAFGPFWFFMHNLRVDGVGKLRSVTNKHTY